MYGSRTVTWSAAADRKLGRPGRQRLAGRQAVHLERLAPHAPARRWQFVDGLPLVPIDLKNPADANANVWRPCDRIQTDKAQVPEVFQYNEVLVISDGGEAQMGSLSANSER